VVHFNVWCELPWVEVSVLTGDLVLVDGNQDIRQCLRLVSGVVVVRSWLSGQIELGIIQKPG